MNHQLGKALQVTQIKKIAESRKPKAEVKKHQVLKDKIAVNSPLSAGKPIRFSSPLAIYYPFPAIRG